MSCHFNDIPLLSLPCTPFSLNHSLQADQLRLLICTCQWRQQNNSYSSRGECVVFRTGGTRRHDSRQDWCLYIHAEAAPPVSAEIIHCATVGALMARAKETTHCWCLPWMRPYLILDADLFFVTSSSVEMCSIKTPLNAIALHH